MPAPSRTPPIAKLIQAPALVLMLLSGCVSYVPRPLELVALAGNFESRALDDPELHRYIERHLGADSSPTVVWNLSKLTLAAYYYSPELDVARARWDSSKAAVWTIR